MPNYLLAYKGGGMPDSDAEREQVMAAWGRWFGALGEALVDAGNPFGPSKSISSNGLAADGGASGLTGYSILKAHNLDAAAEHAKGCPILASGGTIEVYEGFAVM
jgi:hypothetical protein